MTVMRLTAERLTANANVQDAVSGVTGGGGTFQWIVAVMTSSEECVSPSLGVAMPVPYQSWTIARTSSEKLTRARLRLLRNA